jgi:hypothetical protein
VLKREKAGGSAVIDLKTADALGLTVPPTLVSVIE